MKATATIWLCFSAIAVQANVFQRLVLEYTYSNQQRQHRKHFAQQVLYTNGGGANIDDYDSYQQQQQHDNSSRNHVYTNNQQASNAYTNSQQYDNQQGRQRNQSVSNSQQQRQVVKTRQMTKTRKNSTPALLSAIANSLKSAFYSKKSVLVLFTAAALIYIGTNFAPNPFLQRYCYALAGSSIGFYNFIYFISYGYALGVGVPTLLLLLSLNINTVTMVPINFIMILLWSLRLVTFLYWRQYVSWPALNNKIQNLSPPSILTRVVFWLFYSLFFACLAPNSNNNYSSWPLLQIAGLLLESVADYQKCVYKQKQTTTRTGLHKYSTHPNYAGEWLFWVGSSRNLDVPRIVGLLFVSFILCNAVRVSDTRRQGDEFYANYGTFGPKLHTIKQAITSYRDRRKISNASTQEVKLTVEEMKRLGMIPEHVVVIPEDDIAEQREFE